MGASNLIVSRVSLTSEGEWDELIAGYWASWLDPFQATGELTFADLGTGSSAEQKAFSKLRKDLLSQARSDPDNTVWLKCVDVQLKRIIGGGMYKIHRANPYRAGAPIPVADWFPDGSEKRALAEAMYRQLWAWRARLMTEKHFCGCALWTLPEYRSQGAAGLILERFVRHADEFQMEAYLEGSEMAVRLYEQYGFTVVSEAKICFEPPDGTSGSADWWRLVHDLQSHPVSIMWRPVGGQQGVKYPWEKDGPQSKL
ncbi:uncharacterized protein BO88DRAFT_413171 [Aspergillus vadensis CBS 113365]|uniref:N-acetyltransferase domain-containing protein n=1 Tax=Aspergillus vadensis (strain CBS 113365 / IMI 142717 / IBT 24658) TaxID=1448311 RepID=A0A319C6Q3_ASPVC|nr:hypothetical protein BO88DRAFT_413171 [Aspergillus vadensis CBS 113365]PYH70988.1 hypothetical protein BO88DRAFT_413171 [Aspergillus vadensis CBS 113365]